MVAGSKKPKAASETAPKKASKAGTTASKPKAAAKPKTAGVKAKIKMVKKTGVAVKAPIGTPKKAPKVAVKVPKARKVGEMVYNDEVFESLSEAILLGGSAEAALLPELKKELFDYDIYMVSFLSDEELESIAAGVSKGGAAALKPLLEAVRDNARVFVSIATGYNSVRAYIDRELKEEGKDKLKVAFVEGEYCLKGAGPETCESFLMLF